MPIEADAEQVEDLALEEVCARPDRRERIDIGVVAGEPDLQPQVFLVDGRKEVVDDLEARLARVPIDAGEIGERVVLQLGVVLQRLAGLAQCDAIDPDGQLVAVELGAGDSGAVVREQRRDLWPILQLLDVGDCRLQCHA